MKYKFPVIKTIDDVLPYVDPAFFIVAERPGHKIINYQFSTKDTFPDATDDASIMRREFRGLIFNDAGQIIRRPYHKFFNVGERSEVFLENIDVSCSHVILDKMDGSMICPYMVEGRIIWGTKMGDTEVALPVQKFVDEHSNYEAFARVMLEDGYTPIFEWCSRKQRIVLDYQRDQLVLTAIRAMVSGEYLSYDRLLAEGQFHRIPVVHAVYGEQLSPEFIQATKSVENAEGFVIRFADGHMTKIKGDWYCQLHRVKSDLQFEKGVVLLLLDEKIDDLKPLMPVEDLDRINQYEASFWKNFDRVKHDIRSRLLIIEGTQISRKDFALNVAPTLEPHVASIIFKMWGNNGADPDLIGKYMKDVIVRNCTRNSKFEELRKTSLFKDVPVWETIFIGDDE